MVGEGGNLGLTQRGRVEYALTGGRVNTDAIDNSAGVDTSDHEVNIKIALNRAVDDGELDADGRAALLGEMTDEVAVAVLSDNHAQNATLAVEVTSARSLLDAHERLLRSWSGRGAWCAASRRCPTSGAGRAAPRRPGADRPRAVGAARLRQARDRGRRPAVGLPDDPALEDLLTTTSRPSSGSGSRRRSRATRCGGRSSRPR